MSEIPVHLRPRRLADWINPTDARKVHSLVDKVYQKKNLEMAWEKVKAKWGSGGVDGQSLEAFAADLDQQLDRLHRELPASPVEAHRRFPSGSWKASNARSPANRGWSSVAPDRGDAEGRKLWQRAALSQRVRDSSGRGSYSLNAKGNFQFVRIIAGWRERYALLDLRRKK